MRLTHERFRSDTQGLIKALQQALGEFDARRNTQAQEAEWARRNAEEESAQEHIEEDRSRLETEQQRVQQQHVRDEPEATRRAKAEGGHRHAPRRSMLVGSLLGVAVLCAGGFWLLVGRSTPDPTAISSAPPAAAPAPTPAAPVPTSTAPAPSGPSAPPQTYTVVVTSQRSEADAQAAYVSLQAKFPQQLGGRPAIIHRADLGDKGVYYRATVGSFAAAEDAAKLCSSLKAAGGSCIVQRY